MKGYCKGCGKEIDETEITAHKCDMFDFKPEYEYYHDGMITRRRKTN